MIYPIKVNGDIRSSVTVAKSGEDWQVTSFGRPKWTKAVAKIIAQKTVTGNIGYSDNFILHIASLYILLLGRYEQENLILTQVHDHDELALSAGDSGPAAELLIKIQQGIKGYSGALSVK